MTRTLDYLRYFGEVCVLGLLLAVLYVVAYLAGMP